MVGSDTPKAVLDAFADRRRVLIASAVGALIVGIGGVAGSVSRMTNTVNPRPPLPADTGLRNVLERGALRVAMDASYPPFAVAEANGSVVGFNVELANVIAALMAVNVQILNISDDGLRDALIAGKADVVISQILPMNAYELLYSIPYYNAGLVLVERHPARLPATRAALAGKTIAVEWGGDADQWIHDQKLRDVVIMRVSTVDAAAKAVEDGRAQGFITDTTQALLVQRRLPDLVIMQPRLTSAPYVVAVAPQNQSLLLVVDFALKRLIETGQLPALVQRYF